MRLEFPSRRACSGRCNPWPHLVAIDHMKPTGCRAITVHVTVVPLATSSQRSIASGQPRLRLSGDLADLGSQFREDVEHMRAKPC
jgi:hypothetical protein